MPDGNDQSDRSDRSEQPPRRPERPEPIGSQRTHDGVVPKVTGADIELGNMIVGGGPSRQTTANAGDAARAILAQVRGHLRRPLSSYSSYQSPTPTPTGTAGTTGWHYGGAYTQSGGAASSQGDTATSSSRGYYEWEQDYGRKFLTNGGCAYIDMGHAELALPETLSAFDHLAAHAAMLRVARDAVQAANDRMPQGQSVKATVNNGNGNGASWGSHLNILITREARDNLFSRRLNYLLFLASYQCCSIVLTGAGKVGADRGGPVRYQISARSDFLGEGGMISANTTYDRPLVNSRDESLTGDDHTLARLHCIFFDSTLCHTATLLRVGMSQLVTCMIEQQQVPGRLLLDDPVEALHAWSRDPALTQTAALLDGSRWTAVELLQAIHEQAKRFVDAGRADGLVPEAGRIIQIWGDCLQALARRDFDYLAGRIDWVAKQRLLESAAERRGVAWESPAMRYLDLSYSLLSAEGLYWALERAGAVQTLAGEGAIERYVHEPPEDTRAWLRGYVVRHAEPGTLDDVDWDLMRFRQKRDAWPGTWGYYSYYNYPVLTMSDPLGFTRRQCEPTLRSAPSLLQGLRALGLGAEKKQRETGGSAGSAGSALVPYEAPAGPGGAN